MKRKQPVPRKAFTGALKAPIRYTYHAPSLLLSEDELAERHAAEVAKVASIQTEKTLLLFDHYGIERGDWMHLACALARDFVPGLRTIEKDDGKKPKKWTAAAAFIFAAEIDSLKQEKPRNDREACRAYLRRKGLANDEAAVSSLITRLHEARKQPLYRDLLKILPGDKAQRQARLISLADAMAGKK